ncbi:flagellar biosynthetic protein FliR [Tuberibacillus sp. Marseille-P3662]|uniref:flagellar biosynthetic protein FliR n=1 Tax=Tuberibacillus sp. Marseille-P3662 TaxID=1965358 RepID=UPI000A1CCE18|nr:flagellar biosynthetic protein FliR [Tuberibacillus sp. Marseille-P3662]
MALIDTFPVFLLVLVRLASFLMVAPLFSYHTVPGRFKLALAAVLAILMTLTIQPDITVINHNFLMLVLKETMVGLSLGFIAAMIVYSVQVAGIFIDLQMGFAFASIVDPQTGNRIPLTGRFLYVLILLFLLAVNAHHMLLNGIFYSFELIPVDQVGIAVESGELARFVVQVFVKMFLIAFQIALPIVGCIFLVDVALGVIARTVPQVNVFVVGLPLKILVSMMVLLIVIPIYVSVFRYIFELMTQIMKNFMMLLGS